MELNLCIACSLREKSKPESESKEGGGNFESLLKLMSHTEESGMDMRLRYVTMASLVT